MRVTNLGHDGLRVVPGDGPAVLIDPWLNPSGAFAGGWFPFPPAGPQGDDEAWRSRALADVEAVIVTQALPEHLDPWVLAQLPSEVPVLVPRTPSGELTAAVTALAPQRPLVELAPWQWRNLSRQTRVAVVPEVSARHAAALLVEAHERRPDGPPHKQVLVHVGEAKLSALDARCMRVFLGEAAPQLVTMRTRVAGFSPLCTAADPQRREMRAKQARRERQEAALTLLRILKPEAACVAGPSVCLLEEGLLSLQAELEGGPHTEASEEAETFHRRFAHQVRPWQRGDAVELAAPETSDTSGRLALPDTPAQRHALLADLAAAKKPVVGQARESALGAVAQEEVTEADCWEAVRTYFERLVESCEGLRRRINLRVWIEASGPGERPLGRYRVDLRERAEVRRLTLKEPFGVAEADDGGGPTGDATLCLPANWLVAACRGETCDWSTVLYSLRFRFTSEASRTRLEQLLELLCLAGSAPQTAGERASARVAATQWLAVPHPADGTQPPYWVGRHCPHAQVDLRTCGELLPEGTLRCLAHSYDFALADGRCLNAPECEALPVERKP